MSLTLLLPCRPLGRLGQYEEERRDKGEAGRLAGWEGFLLEGQEVEREKPSKNFVKLYVEGWDMKTKMLLNWRCGKCQAVISGAHRGLWHCGFMGAVLVIISI